MSFIARSDSSWCPLVRVVEPCLPNSRNQPASIGTWVCIGNDSKEYLLTGKNRKRKKTQSVTNARFRAVPIGSEPYNNPSCSGRHLLARNLYVSLAT